MHFDATPAEPGIVYVGVREAGATAWPLYGISVTRTTAGLLPLSYPP